MGLEHRGSRFTEDQDIIRLLDAKARNEEVTDSSDAGDLIRWNTSDFATKNYVDSAFDSFATQADVDAAYANKAPASALGSSLLQLNDDREIDPSYLPSQSTRGARWFNGGAIRVPGRIPGEREFFEVGDGGWLNSSTGIASLTITGSSMGNRPYYILGYGQVEVKGNFSGSLPQLFITTSSSSLALGSHIAAGHGIPSWLSHYHVSIIPTSRNNSSTTTLTGNTYLNLACRSEGATSDVTEFMGRWGALAIPVY